MKIHYNINNLINVIIKINSIVMHLADTTKNQHTLIEAKLSKLAGHSLANGLLYLNVLTVLLELLFY